MEELTQTIASDFEDRLAKLEKIIKKSQKEERRIDKEIEELIKKYGG